MADWDDEDFEPQEFGGKQSDKWEGEDEDENDVKENWDDEEEDESEKKPETTQDETVTEAPQAKVKKRKTIKQVLQEKEEKAKEQTLRREEDRKLLKEEEEKPLTEEEELAEKLRRQKLVEESDLELAKQAFGVRDDLQTKSIDGMNPRTREEFVELSQLIVGKLSNYESSSEYIPFLEMLFRDLCVSLEAEDVKRLGSAINILSTEKIKAQKTKKGKKSVKKATLSGTSAKAGRKEDLDAFGGGNYDYGDEFDDFM